MKKLLLFFFSLLFYVFAIPHSVYAATEFTVSNPRVVNGNFLVDLYLPNPPDNDNLCSAFITGHQVYIITSQGNRVRDFADCSSLGNGNYTVTSPGIPFTGTYTIEAVGRWVEPFYDIFTSNSFDWFNPPPNFPPAIQLTDSSQPTEIPGVRQVAVDLGQAYTVEGSFTDADSTSWAATVDYEDGAGSEALPLNGTDFSLQHTYNQGGTYFVTITVTDDQGAGGTLTRAVSVLDYSLTASNPRVVNGEFTVDLHGFPPDNLCSWFPAFRHDAYTVNSNGTIFHDFAGCTAHGNGNYTITGSPVPPDGTYTIKIEEREQPPYPFVAASNSFVWVANKAPEVSPLSGATISEGGTYTENGSFADSDSSTSWTGTVDYGDGSGVQPLPINPDKTFTLHHQFTDNKPGNAQNPVTVVITDDAGASDTEPASVTVNNVAPQVGAITTSANPVQVNTATTASSSFTDPAGTQDAPYTLTWNWGDGNVDTETVSAPGAVSKAHTYTQAGVYEIILTVTDKDGGAGEQTFQYLSVYSPTAQGLFSAGQKYTSPLGAYPQDPTATGNVMFGLSYKYQGDMPSGNRQFTMDFKTANFEFNATTVSSLVISNGVGTLRGSGTITGRSGVFDFLVVGNEATDAIRIQIKDASGNIVYDPQPGAADTATPATPVTAGNVLAH
jgi:PKD repeat protein